MERRIVLVIKEVVIVMKTTRRMFLTSLTIYCQELADLSDKGLLIFAILNPLNQTSK